VLERRDELGEHLHAVSVGSRRPERHRGRA
jgi:hypothetical protein